MLSTLRKQFFDVRQGEWPLTLALSAHFFLVIAVFWILKPIKRGIIIAYYGGENAGFDLFGLALSGAQTEQLGKVLNMFVAYFVVILFTLAVRHLKRRQVVYLFSGVVGLVIALFTMTVANPGVGTVWTFYVFGDIFNTIMVATFWAFAADLIRSDQSRRLYGLIGLGGVIGGFVGSTMVSGFVEPLGRPGLLWMGVAGVALIVVLAWFADQRAEPHTPDQSSRSKEETGGDAEGRKQASAAIEGAQLVFRSRYLLGIMALIGLYELVSNIIDFQLAASIESYESGGTEYDEAFGFVGQLIGLGSIFVQLFLTTFVMSRFGVGTALLFLPIAVLLSSTGFLIVPIIGFAIAMSVSDNALNYSINQSAKEALYTPTTPDEKYKAKAFIDMFVQRGAKVAAVVLNLGLTTLIGLAFVRWLSIVSLVGVVLWILVVRYLGKRFAEQEEEQRTEVPV